MSNVRGEGITKLKITFISNYMTAHQKPFCDELFHLLDGEFRFIETEIMDVERKAQGWRQYGELPYCISWYESEEAATIANEWIDTSDVVIIGGTSDFYIRNRLKNNQVIYRYEERIFKQGAKQLLKISIWYMLYKCHISVKRKNVYMLCASGYLPSEMRYLKAYKNKLFKWGYFPETKKYEIESLMEQKRNEITEIVWSARFIDWKHPEMVIWYANTLRNAKVKFHITMIGSGELWKETSKKVSEQHLEEFVTLTGAISQEKVREYMEVANIFLATSDRQEGWGAVINEAMNSGCIVIANREMGAVPFLIDQGKNGYVYNSKEECLNRLREQIKSPNEQIGINAYNTIINAWNAEKAAENFVEMIRNGSIPKEGPCSKA